MTNYVSTRIFKTEVNQCYLATSVNTETVLQEGEKYNKPKTPKKVLVKSFPTFLYLPFHPPHPSHWNHKILRPPDLIVISLQELNTTGWKRITSWGNKQISLKFQCRPMAGGRFIPKKSNTVQHCQMTSVCCPFYPSSAVNLTAPNINNLSFFSPFHSLLVLVESLVVGSVSSASNYLAVNRIEFFFFCQSA